MNPMVEQLLLFNNAKHKKNTTCFPQAVQFQKYKAIFFLLLFL